MKNQYRVIIGIVVLVLVCFVCLVACYIFAGPAALAAFYLYGSTLTPEDSITRCEYSSNGYTIKMVEGAEIYGKETDFFSIIRESDNKTVYTTDPKEEIINILVLLSKDHVDSDITGLLNLKNDGRSILNPRDGIVDSCVQEVKVIGDRVEVAGSFISTDGGNSFKNMVPPQDTAIAEQIAKLINAQKPTRADSYPLVIIQSAEFKNNEQFVTYDFEYAFVGGDKEVVLSRTIGKNDWKVVSVKDITLFSR